MITIIAIQNGSQDVIPFGTLFIASTLKRNGFDVELIHLPDNKIENIPQHVETILKKETEWIGIGLMSTEAAYAALFSKEIKKLNKEIPIVWGGYHPSMTAELCLKESYVDYVVIAEGEVTVIELANFIRNGSPPREEILGLGYKNNGEIVINKRRPLIPANELDNYKLDWSLIDMPRYIHKSTSRYKRSIQFITSRGCSGYCTFCTNHLIMHSTHRGFSVEWVKEMLRPWVEKYDIDHITYYDDSFFDDKERALELLEAVNIPFRADIIIDSVDYEFIERLKELKCEALFFGFESGNDRLLKLICKRQRVKDMIEKMKILAQFPSIQVKGSGIILLPTETKEETRNTINIALELGKINPNFVPQIGTYLPYPGVSLSKLVLRQGWSFPEKIEDWGLYSRYNINHLDCSWIPWLNKREKKKLGLMFEYLPWCSKFYSNKYFFSRPKAFLGSILYRLSYFRIKHHLYALPFEIKFYNKIWKKIRYSNWFNKSADIKRKNESRDNESD